MNKIKSFPFQKKRKDLYWILRSITLNLPAMNMLKITSYRQLPAFFSYLFLSLVIIESSNAQDGATLFADNCAVCHTVGQGTLVGPDLANVQMRREKTWINSFIRGSSIMIKNGDQTAVAIFAKFNNTVMPDQDFFSDAEIDAILAYIESTSPEFVAETKDTSKKVEPEKPVEPAVVGRSVEEATEEDIARGRLLFSGQTRLESGGPSCLSCHNVRDDRLIGGGLLAKDLTQVFSRLNENGIKGMLSNPPFPAMRKAYENHPINSDEAFLLTAFLKSADLEQYYQHDRDYQARFLFSGLGGLAVLLILFSLIWRKRKSNAVMKKVFDRQIRSESYNF
jgi:mono/diheme cytochrome c family protein